MYQQAVSVPIQGFLNALAYGWTRREFLTVMSSQQHTVQGGLQTGSQTSACNMLVENKEEEIEVGDEWEDQMSESIHAESNWHQQSGMEEKEHYMTPPSSGHF